jgi:cytochrome c-type biogenesis protein CcmH/NrfF
VRRLALTAALLLALLPAAATAATPRTTFNDVEDEVMCVACGVPLPIAESPQADQERAVIRRLIAQGLTKDQVKAQLVKTYGTDRILATPKDSGFGLAAYLVPIVLVLAALGGLAFALPRWRANRGGGDDRDPDGDSPTALTDADAARLDADLARYEV